MQIVVRPGNIPYYEGISTRLTGLGPVVTVALEIQRKVIGRKELASWASCQRNI